MTGSAKQSRAAGKTGLLRRGACHRARIRATRWLLAMTTKFDSTSIYHALRLASLSRQSLALAPGQYDLVADFHALAGRQHRGAFAVAHEGGLTLSGRQSRHAAAYPKLNHGRVLEPGLAKSLAEPLAIGRLLQLRTERAHFESRIEAPNRRDRSRGLLAAALLSITRGEHRAVMPRVGPFA